MAGARVIAIAPPASGAPTAPVLVFRMCPADRPLVVETVRALSARSLYLRFGRPVTPEALDLQWVDALEGPVHVGYGAIERATGRPLGVARYARVGDGAADAEIAVTVVDAWQGRGVGRLMLSGLAVHARAAGIATLHASVLAGNRPALPLVRGLGGRPVAVSRGTVELAADLGAR